MSDDLEQAVARHYGRGDITKPILDGLKSAGIDIDGLSLEDLAPVDEFHIGGRAASEYVLAKLALTPDHHVLDIGCGIGGTARFMAKSYGCRVTGIDLTPEFIAQSFVFYPGFVFGQSGFDVGVVFLAEDLPRTAVPILTSRQGSIGETAIIAGFGRNENSDTTALRAGSTTIAGVTSVYLESLYAPPASSICSGDSGGPIFLSQGGAWVIAGISSATTGSACNQGTNFYQAIANESVRNFVVQLVPSVAQR